MSAACYTTKGCPFCGSDRSMEDVVLNTGGNKRFIRCRNCDAQGPWSTGSFGPLEQWNRRTDGPNVPAWRYVVGEDLPMGPPCDPSTTIFAFDGSNGHWEYELPALPSSPATGTP